MKIKIQNRGYMKMIIGYIDGYMHSTLGWIHGTAWIHQWIHDLFNRFQMFLLQKCIEELAMYNWNHFVHPWIHLPSWWCVHIEIPPLNTMKIKLLESKMKPFWNVKKIQDLWIHEHDNLIHRWTPLWILLEHREFYRIFTTKQCPG